MTIKTSRTNEDGRRLIDYDKCTTCGLCVKICPDESLMISEDKLVVNPSPIFGCFACGHCVAICPNDAISVSGRTVSSEDFLVLPSVEKRANYDQLYSLLFSRRSTRRFKEKEIDEDAVRKILEATTTAPMGIPPSDVKTLLLSGRKKVREFASDFFRELKRMNKAMPVMLTFMRPFMSKDQSDRFKHFIQPLMKHLEKEYDEGKDALLYDAPLAIYFYSTLFGDPADSYIAATYSTLAAEALGIGSCMVGTVEPVVQRGSKDFKKKYGFVGKVLPGIMVIFGYPKYKFRKGVKRTLANQ